MQSSSPGEMFRTEVATSRAEFPGKATFMFGAHEWFIRATDAKRAVPCIEGHAPFSSCSSDIWETSARACAIAAVATCSSFPCSAACIKLSICTSVLMPFSCAATSISSPKMPVVSSPQTQRITHSFSRSRASSCRSSACASADPLATSTLALFTSTCPRGECTSRSMLLYSKRPSTSEKNPGPAAKRAVTSAGACGSKAAFRRAAASFTRPSVWAKKSPSFGRPGGGRHASLKGAWQKQRRSCMRPCITC
mmetsp:Transcript_58289/g.109109  ORF Transcript_58289/g.109109 Transcript_58289/m.109109 type:complete len:251 (+) Transcript_58289:220-972(+)